MIIVTRIDQFNENNIYFCDPIKNNIMCDGYFYRIFYSNCMFTLNGIYLVIPFHDFYCEKYYNKYKCMFDANSPNYIRQINEIKKIEEGILNKVEIKNKIPQYKIYAQLKNNFVKVFQESPIKRNATMILKISGIWENATHYGITYKFICSSTYPLEKTHLL